MQTSTGIRAAVGVFARAWPRAAIRSAQRARRINRDSALERISHWHVIVGIALRGDPRNLTRHAAEGVPYANQESARKRRSATASGTLGFGLLDIWRDAWLTFIAHAPAILMFAVMGVLATQLMGVVGGTRVLATAAGMLMLVLARGGITWLALQGTQSMATFAAMCRAVCRGLPALLFGALVYGAAITLGSTGLGLVLRDVSLDVPQQVMPDSQTRPLLSKAAQSLLTHGTESLIPDPGTPVSAWLPDLRAAVFMRSEEITPSPYATVFVPGSTHLVPRFSSHDREYGWITAGSLLLIVLAETLLRFRVVMAMQAGKVGAIVPLIGSLHLGLKHFVRVTVHVWLLRLVPFAFSLAFVIAPTAVIQEIIVPKLWPLLNWLPGLTGWGWFGSQPQMMALAGCIAFINVLVSIFEAVYVARLYLALKSLG